MPFLRILFFFVILFFTATTSFCQKNSIVEIDPDFLAVVYELVEENTKPRFSVSSPGTSFTFIHNTRIANKYKSKNEGKFDYLIELHTQLAKENKGILKTKFLKKPSINELASIYLNSKVKQNNWAGNEKLSVEELIKWELTQMTEERLVYHYYRLISLNPTISKRRMGGRNIDFNSLGLSNREGSLLYYNLIDAFSLEYLRKNIRSNKLHCSMAKRVMKSLPTFEGKEFFEFEPENLEDFSYVINKFREPVFMDEEGSYNTIKFLKLSRECGLIN